MEVLKQNPTKAEEIAKSICNDYQKINWNDGICYIFKACIKHPQLSAHINGSCAEDIIKKWVDKYIKGKQIRISQRISKFSRTVADPIISEIIKSRIKSLTADQLEKIKYAHRLSMSAENILGLLLEEYLADNLLEFKWHFAWGETIKSVDFCSEDLKLLQIKNRSNSENSSSSSVRVNTTITKWYRVDANTGIYKWDELNQILKTSKFNEDSFIDYVKKILLANPNALAVEENNPWL